jgi:modified peptide precursor CbpA
MHAHACLQPEPFLFFYFPEEWNMSQTTPVTSNTSTPSQPVAPTIAVRKSCNPDGIGLSHYVLMDKKVAK